MPLPDKNDQFAGIPKAKFNRPLGGPGTVPVRGNKVFRKDILLSCEVNRNQGPGFVYNVSEPGALNPE